MSALGMSIVGSVGDIRGRVADVQKESESGY